MEPMDRELELRLVAGLRAGDVAAFDAVYDAFHARLYTFLTRLSSRRDVAEDLVEDVWLRVISHASGLRPDTRLAPWLYTIARNLYASRCRSRMVEDSCRASLLGLWPAGSPPPSPLAIAEASESQRRLEVALATLPATCREALVLVAIEGWQPSHAADICGVTPEAMRQRLSRARALLARVLREHDHRGLCSLKEVTP